MKQILLNFCLISFIFVVAGLNSCRKPDPKKDPCLNPVTVNALSADHYYLGHFFQEDALQGVYLKAENYHEYASKIIPGRSYELSYQEKNCYQNKTQDKNFQSGGCFIVQKCVRITCLREKPRTCNNTFINMNMYETYGISGGENAHINGNTLNATIGFSGCSGSEIKDFSLIVRPLLERCPPTMGEVFLARISDTRIGYTCMAYFTKNSCFDLTPIRDYYINKNMQIPQQVTIRLQKGNEYQDLKYVMR